MPTFVQILDFIGTFAFAISGIRLASAKRFDWFGAYVVGLATAIGGGTIRDVPVSYTHLPHNCIIRSACFCSAGLFCGCHIRLSFSSSGRNCCLTKLPS